MNRRAIFVGAAALAVSSLIPTGLARINDRPIGEQFMAALEKLTHKNRLKVVSYLRTEPSFVGEPSAARLADAIQVWAWSEFHHDKGYAGRKSTRVKQA